MNNKSNVEISVIMPVFNGEDYLKQAIDSLLSQTFQSFEIICVDDGSEETTRNILKEYCEKDERIQVFFQDHKGAGEARNFGLSKAVGTYVIFLDSDDVFCESMLEKIVNKGNVTRSDVIVFGAKRLDNRTGQTKYTPWYLRREMIPDGEVFSRKQMNGRLLEITIPSPWTKAYKREFLLKEGIRFQNLTCSNDVYFALVSLSVAESISAIKEDLLFYRIFREGSVQNKKYRDPLCFLSAYEAAYNELHRRNIYEDVQKGFCNRVISGCIHNLETVNNEKAKWEIIEALCSERFTRMGVLDCKPDDYRNKKDRDLLAGLPYALLVHEKMTDEKNDNLEVVIEQNNCETENKVSVVIPVYNTEKYLRDCMDSILNQSLKEIEVICVDDGSIDDSLKLLCEYAKNDSRVSVYHQENRGQSVARNLGLEKATGEYIYFMDSDDMLKVDALEKLYHLAKKNELDTLYFDAETIYENERLKEEKPNLENYYIREGEYSKQCSGIDMFLNMNQLKEYRVNPGIQFFKRQYLRNNDLKFYPGIIYEDNDFTMRAMLLSQHSGYIHEKFFVRRIRESSTITNSADFLHVYGYFRTFLNMLIFVSDKKYSDEFRSVLNDMIFSTIENAKKKYQALSVEERYGVMGLKMKEQLLFRVMVADEAELFARYHEIHEKLHQTYAEKSEINRKLQITYGEKYDRGIEIKRLKKELDSIRKSRSYKLARVIGYPVRVFRGIRKRILGEK